MEHLEAELNFHQYLELQLITSYFLVFTKSLQIATIVHFANCLEIRSEQNAFL